MSVTTNREGAAPAVSHPGDFEEWLDRQKGRQDRTGAVARFVLEDLERGCWPDSIGLWSEYKRNDEERQQAWVHHLIARHDMPSESVTIFREVHAEYVEAYRRYLEWYRAEEDRQAKEGRGWLPPYIPGEIEALEDGKRFWQRIRKAQGKPTR